MIYQYYACFDYDMTCFSGFNFVIYAFMCCVVLCSFWWALEHNESLCCHGITALCCQVTK